MSRLYLVLAALLALSFPQTCTLHSAEKSDMPAAQAIQVAMNEGVEVDFPEFQEIVAVNIRSGGVTHKKDYLLVCEGKLVWKIDSKEFKANQRREFEEQAEKLGEQGKMLKAFAPLFHASLDRYGSFEKGQTVTKVRFRVRLERAGADWVVTSSKIVEFDTNPLRSLKSQDDSQANKLPSRSGSRTRNRN